MSEQQEAPQPSPGPRVVLPQPGIGLEPDGAFQPPEPPPSLLRSVIWSLLLGAVGAGIWAAITLITDYQLGLIAVAVGFLAGIGAARGGRGPRHQLVGAVVAAGSYFLGQTIIVVAIVLGQMGGEDVDLTAEAEQAGIEHTIAGEPAGAAAEQGADEIAAPADDALADAPVDTDEDGEPSLIMGLGMLLLGVLEVSFQGPMDLLFLAIAVWEGWRIPREEHV
ncbi:MAG: hypothetical protein KC933_05015 [Myxococcales bacterium]|nr:hypothetical protein [Myxococcales bacterium]MCB9645170.1 hypothetical protein [Deltaproteobacteria bacterium]